MLSHYLPGTVCISRRVVLNFNEEMENGYFVIGAKKMCVFIIGCQCSCQRKCNAENFLKIHK